MNVAIEFALIFRPHPVHYGIPYVRHAAGTDSDPATGIFVSDLQAGWKENVDFLPVLGMLDILVRIRIRGNGSGSGKFLCLLFLNQHLYLFS